METEVSLCEILRDEAFQVISNCQISMEGAGISLSGSSHVLNFKLGILGKPEIPSEVVSTLDSSHMHIARSLSFPLCT